MLLNSDNILNFIPNGIGKFGKKTQVGIDLSVINIRKIKGGKLYRNGKREIDNYEDVDYYIERDKEEEFKTWILDKGVYSLTFEQSIKLDNKHSAFIRNRSSILRIGSFITSGVFDPGFECKNIGATLFVFNNGIEIQKDTRLAQLIIFENQETNLYKGNYQGDKDLK